MINWDAKSYGSMDESCASDEVGVHTRLDSNSYGPTKEWCNAGEDMINAIGIQLRLESVFRGQWWT